MVGKKGDLHLQLKALPAWVAKMLNWQTNPTHAPTAIPHAEQPLLTLCSLDYLVPSFTMKRSNYVELKVLGGTAPVVCFSHGTQRWVPPH